MNPPPCSRPAAAADPLGAPADAQRRAAGLARSQCSDFLYEVHRSHTAIGGFLCIGTIGMMHPGTLFIGDSGAFLCIPMKVGVKSEHCDAVGLGVFLMSFSIFT
jgi:hypothetical protein